MEAVKESTTEYFILIQRQEVVRQVIEEDPPCIPIPLAVKKKGTLGPALKTIAVKTAKAAAILFWIVCLGGFLVVTGQLAAKCLRLFSGGFFSALDNHNFLWYITAVWKKNP